jgi:hypothetical protein
MSMLDVFKADGFSQLSLTDAVDKIPHIPGRAGQVIDWDEEPVSTVVIGIEEIEGELNLVDPSPRGGPGDTQEKEKRTLRDLRVPHYEVQDNFMADEVLAIRRFGEESMLQTLEMEVNAKMERLIRRRIDPTLEYQRVGALKGVILNANGDTLYDLFTEFGVTQETEIDFDLDNGSPASGVVRKKCTQVVRLVANNLGGLPYRGIVGFAGDNFWDDLIAHSEVRATFLNQAEASQLRNDAAFQQLDYGGIRFENYRGSAGGSAFIDTDKCHFFPVGVPGLWRTINAPPDVIQDPRLPAMGMPRYARQYPMANGKGIHIEVQANQLNYCTRPKVLIKAKRT